MKIYIPVILFFFLSFFSCQKKERIENLQIAEQVNISDSVYYAEGFRIERHADYTLATVRNPWDSKLVLQRYVLVPKASALPESLPEGILIRTPLERTVCYGSVQCSFLAEFGALETVIGVCEPQYINIPYIQENIKSGLIANLGQSANPNIEKIMLIEPEALFTAPIEGLGYGQVAKLGVPFIECVDYMESSPLGRAEWIRFLALFFEKDVFADSLFRNTVEVYEKYQAIANAVIERPTVMTETIYNGVWYVPGGNSYIAQFLCDAGADYLWKDNKSSGSLALSFEAVLEKAEKANCWLIKHNNPDALTYNNLIKEYPNYGFFDAYKQKNIYLCNTGTTPYYEELPVHPDRILKDMVWIFHPELMQDYKPRYYVKMNE
ncbi:MAG: ABC transporter substrate-binding protein [Dysgonamonadaceae bacterium]|jgi:iron complex transport system substrate-binding protein|nr:ABC transporter substrate-binding protein [Dysgonamonadaceae bacterium]